VNDPVPLPMDPPELTRQLEAFLHEEITKAGFSRAIVGVSGGLDSAVVLLLTARALGAENVLALRMPHRDSSPESLAHADLAIDRAGCPAETLDVTAPVEAAREVLGADDPLRRGNLAARVRMAFLYDRAMARRALVVGTSNKTELLLGYSTRWGDGAWDLDPVGDLYKCQVRRLGEHLGVPGEILGKPPSADLWPGQTDEAELGFTYEDADRLLWLVVDRRVPPAEAIDRLGLDRELGRTILERMRRTQFKRALPLVCKVQARTIGIDFRYPRDWGL